MVWSIIYRLRPPPTLVIAAGPVGDAQLRSVANGTWLAFSLDLLLLPLSPLYITLPLPSQHLIR